MFQLKPEDTRVILIGASVFEDEELPSLPAIKDNNVKLRTLLHEVVGIGKDNIHILEDRDYANQITAEISKTAAKGLDIIYYAGHGLPHLKQLYLATKKTEHADPESSGALLANSLLRIVINKSKAKRIIFILDCCFSGFARENVDTKGKDIFLITATSSVETAKSEAPENYNYTAFTFELLEILEHGIDGVGGILTLDNIFSHLKKQLENKKLLIPRITSYGQPDELRICKNKAYKTAPIFSIKPFSIKDVPQHALIIGNADYAHAKLNNPTKDATDMANSLQMMGFNVDLALDLNQVKMGKAIRDFVTNLSQKPGLGLFYFAGHGYQVDGENYLLPIDNDKIADKHDLQAYAINVNLQIIERMEHNHLNLIILDACRNNPFRGVMRGHNRGLAYVNPPLGSAIAFATAPGKTAADTSKGGRNGLFTKHLLTGLKYAEQHNQRLDDMFMSVNKNVFNESNGEQISWCVHNLREPVHFGKIQVELKQQIVEVKPDRFPKPVRFETSTGEEFSFEVVTVDKTGKIITREQHVAIQIIENVNNINLAMVYIPAGEFMMGSDEYKREQPIHQVTINQPFYLSKYPITQAQWTAIMGNNPSNFKGEKRPVESVSWNDAVKFCEKLSNLTKQTYRLPSEAEWEYACRAGTTTPFYFGETITTDLANYDGNSTYGSGPKGKYRGETTEVGIFPPNAFGLYDMHGNVYEWCADNWHDNYENAPTDSSVWKNTNKNRVLRGGSWYYFPVNTRAAFRNWYGNPNYDTGFRVVCV